MRYKYAVTHNGQEVARYGWVKRPRYHGFGPLRHGLLRRFVWDTFQNSYKPPWDWSIQITRIGKRPRRIA